jgi:hypothetical protein
MKTQHLNPEFGHTWGEIPEKKLAITTKKKPLTLMEGECLKLTKTMFFFVIDLSFILSFFFPERLHCNIYFHSEQYNYYN